MKPQTEKYVVEKITAGSTKRKAIWQARIYNVATAYYVIGSGSRPELAIRDLKHQIKLWQIS